MWPFNRRKAIIPPGGDVLEQLTALSLKSLTLPEALPNWRLYSRQQQEWLVDTAIREGYNASAIVYAAIEKRAKLIASVPWSIYQEKDGDWEEVTDTPLQKLLDYPNPDQSFHELMYEASQSLDLAGNAFISEIKAGTDNFPVELWLLPAQHIRIYPAAQFRLVDYYKYANSRSANGRRIEADDMIQLKMPNPGDPYYGMPPLKAAGRAADIDREAGIFQKVGLQNRGLSDLMVKIPENSGEDIAEQIREKLRQRQQGPANARAPIVTTGDVKQLNLSPAEMDFVNSRKSVWTEIAAAFGTPLSTLGFTEDVNLANAKEMERSLWSNTIVPQLDLIKLQLNHQLVSEFNRPGRPRIEMRYDLSNVEALQDSLDKKLTNANVLWGMGVPFNTINQRLELGFDEIEGGDVSYIGAGVLPAGFGDDLPDELDDEIEGQEKRGLIKIAYGAK